MRKVIDLQMEFCKIDSDSQYALQTIKDNIVLLTPAILDEINQMVLKTGHSPPVSR